MKPLDYYLSYPVWTSLKVEFIEKFYFRGRYGETQYFLVQFYSQGYCQIIYKMKIENLSMNPAKFFNKYIKQFKVAEGDICKRDLLCGKAKKNNPQKPSIELKFWLV